MCVYDGSEKTVIISLRIYFQNLLYNIFYLFKINNKKHLNYHYNFLLKNSILKFL